MQPEATLGDAIFTTIYDEEHQPCGVRVEQADPRVRISPELVRQWHAGHGQFMSLRCSATCPIGDVITVNGLNRNVVYRIVATERGWLEGDDPYAYIAEWPD